MKFRKLKHNLHTEVEVSDYSELQREKYTFDYGIVDHAKNSFENISEDHKYSLVIPAFNEEKRIAPFLRELSNKIDHHWEVIVVCDGNDRTASIAREIDDRFKVMEFNKRLGKGGAIMEGFRASSGDIVGYVDADGALEYEEINKVFHSLSKDYDVSVGSRWLKNSKVMVKQPIMRILLGRIYHYMSFAVLRLKIKDTQCGLKAFRMSIVKSLLTSVTLKNLSFDTALLYHCMKAGARIVEVPVTWNDVGGSKVHPIKTPLIMFFSLVGLRLAHSKSSKKFNVLFDSIRELLENA